MAWEQVLIDPDKPAENWRITSEELGIKAASPFTVSMRTLHGGRQEGVSLIEIDNGTMKITVIPDRGMNVLEAVAGNVRLGWDSPVDEVVNPAFIELNGRGGLGWLEGFNELVTRCGYEWVGHPGEDNGELLTLHGRAANIPASRVVLQIDEKPPYAIRLRGELKEKAFKKVDFSIMTEFRAAMLEEGARFVAPVKQVSPFNAKAGTELDDWQTYRGPTPGYDETVYNVVPYADANGETLAMLHNRDAELGVTVGFNTDELPVFSLWKNTDTEKQGYVTGLEPGTSYSYNRSYQRPLGLVPTIEPGEQKHFRVRYELLTSKTAVADAGKRIEAIQGGRETEVRQEPLVDLDQEN